MHYHVLRLDSRELFLKEFVFFPEIISRFENIVLHV